MEHFVASAVKLWCLLLWTCQERLLTQTDTFLVILGVDQLYIKFEPPPIAPSSSCPFTSWQSHFLISLWSVWAL